MLFASLCRASLLALAASASPLFAGQEHAAKREADAAIVEQRAAEFKVIKTTKTPEGQTIEWVEIGSQGKIAATPPKLERSTPDPDMPATPATAELENSSAEKGPQGTVPRLRPFIATTIRKQPESYSDKSTPPVEGEEIEKRAAGAAPAAPHRYANSNQNVLNYGGQGIFSVYAPQTEKNDFSLLQFAIARANGAKYPGAPTPQSGRFIQTVEAGVIVFPALLGDTKSHLFTFFNTNGYGDQVDYAAGWNTKVKGWIQVDDTIFPGTIFTTPSTVGDPKKQREMWIAAHLIQGNWWIWVKDRWIGYYPASLFSAGKPDASATLADHADSLSFYGEILDDGTGNPVTTTDMGSGQFSAGHFGKSAYIHNVMYQAKENDAKSSTDYLPVPAGPSQTKEYWDIEPHFAKPFQSEWNSYCWLGGPGRQSS